MYVCMYIYMYIHTCMHTYIHTYIHTYVHTYRLYTSTSSSLGSGPTKMWVWGSTHLNCTDVTKHG